MTTPITSSSTTRGFPNGRTEEPRRLVTQTFSMCVHNYQLFFAYHRFFEALSSSFIYTVCVYNRYINIAGQGRLQQGVRDGDLHSNGHTNGHTGGHLAGLVFLGESLAGGREGARGGGKGQRGMEREPDVYSLSLYD